MGEISENDLNDAKDVTETTEELEQLDSEETELDDELDDVYTEYLENDDQADADNVDKDVETRHLKCRTEELAGKEHPDTGVPFERRITEVDGQKIEVVVPRFESQYDAQLPENMYKEPDRKQFKECSEQLKNEINSNTELREKFSDEEIEQIENGDTPDGYTWHHDADEGKMQLVNTEVHVKTGHTGGRTIWGGGNDNR